MSDPTRTPRGRRPAAPSRDPSRAASGPPAVRQGSESSSRTQAWFAVVRAYNLCDAVMTARLAALGLRVGEHEVLANLHREPGLTQQQLAGRCFVAKSGVSMLVGRMEGEGLVIREPDALDARLRRLRLSARGAALARRSMAVQAEVIAAMAAPVTAAELGVVDDVMRRVSAQLERLLG
jgi:DNA-binding MarR family transcriptional regulator